MNGKAASEHTATILTLDLVITQSVDLSLTLDISHSIYIDLNE